MFAFPPPQQLKSVGVCLFRRFTLYGSSMCAALSPVKPPSPSHPRSSGTIRSTFGQKRTRMSAVYP